MKKVIVFFISLLLMNCINLYGKNFTSESTNSSGDSLRVLSSPDLFYLSVKWVNEYKKLYPDTKIAFINVSDLKLTGVLLEKGNIGFFSKDFLKKINSESIQEVVVGRDIIVLVINSRNPFLNELSQHGISPEAFGRFLNNRDSRKWSDLLNIKENSKADYYWINDESITKGLTGFLKSDQIKFGGIEVKNSEEMISTIQKDPLAIGFCKLVNVLDLNNQTISANIRLVPIDKNNNGLIDYNEKIYDDFNIFNRGVWIGKYPKALYSNIYSVSSNRTKNESEIAFMKWVLTDGQQFLYTNGFSDLLIRERQTTVDKYYSTQIYAGTASNNKSYLKTVLLILVVIILAGITLEAIFRLLRGKKAATIIPGSPFKSVLNENSLIIPAGIYFDKTHTWAFMEQNGIVKVGIDDFLQHITGDITRIKMKKQGEKVKKGEQILSIVQNGKQLNLYSPVSGIIKEQNKSLDEDSSIINSSPYNNGWVYKIEPTNWLRENQLLFMAEKQKQYLKSEFSRLKDFLTLALNSDGEKYSQIVLQDGGELRDGILSNLGPEEWEDFQTKFIDPSRQIWFYELF